jgi:hypothetical protein
MKIAFVKQRFNSKSHILLKQVNAILDEYTAQGFRLTLRQCYYQLVARGLLANKVSEYKRLGALVSNAREAGLVDWDAIEDRTRAARQVTTWDNPGDIVEAAANQYKEDILAGQAIRPEIFVEKEALAGVLLPLAAELRVTCLSCRGYVSSSEMFDSAYRRYRRIIDAGQTPVVIHLGDHDPSGLDMTRDIRRRLALFAGQEIEVQRIALNMDQIEKFNPPPNPCKETDARYGAYVEQYGTECWELDALEPKYLQEITRKAVVALRDDPDDFDARVLAEAQRMEDLKQVSDRFDEVQKFLRDGGDED